ncbi:hypothetical protein FRB94_001042 [Tulasnella sp. JGI-2019a]|nr:hypothetical protein FRB94_001042 [Tulasnella sp. JGI-2019a]
MAANANVVPGSKYHFHDSRVFFHDNDGQRLYGKVVSVELMANGAHVAKIDLDSGVQTTVVLNLLNVAP